MWILKNKNEKKNSNRLINAENKLMVAREEAGGRDQWKRWKDKKVQMGSYRTVTGM